MAAYIFLAEDRAHNANYRSYLWWWRNTQHTDSITFMISVKVLSINSTLLSFEFLGPLLWSIYDWVVESCQRLNPSFCESDPYSVRSCGNDSQNLHIKVSLLRLSHRCLPFFGKLLLHLVRTYTHQLCFSGFIWGYCIMSISHGLWTKTNAVIFMSHFGKVMVSKRQL